MFKSNFSHWIKGETIFWQESTSKDLEELKKEGRELWEKFKGEKRFKLSEKIGEKYSVISEYQI